MKVGLALEGLIVDADSAFQTWLSRQGGASSYLDPKVLRDESFWGALKPQYNVCLNMPEQQIDTFILTERPRSLFLVTRSWLRRYNIEVPDQNIIMQSGGGLKRYDCRLNGLDYFIDSNVNDLSDFMYDRTIPIGIGEGFPEWIRSYKDIASVRFESDLRKWRTWNEEMPQDGEDESMQGRAL